MDGEVSSWVLGREGGMFMRCVIPRLGMDLGVGETFFFIS